MNKQLKGKFAQLPMQSAMRCLYAMIGIVWIIRLMKRTNLTLSMMWARSQACIIALMEFTYFLCDGASESKAAL